MNKLKVLYDELSKRDKYLKEDNVLDNTMSRLHELNLVFVRVQQLILEAEAEAEPPVKDLSKLSIADLAGLLTTNSELMFFLTKEQAKRVERELINRKHLLNWEDK